MINKIIIGCKYIFNSFSHWSIYNTIFFNFKVFPFKKALRLPVKIGRHVTMTGLYKGCVSMDPCKTFSTEIGTCSYPIYANKGQHTLIRISKGSKLILGKNVRVCSGSSIVISRGGLLSIGDEVFVNQQALLYCTYKVTIGIGTSIGWQTQIYDTDFHFIYRDSKHAIENNMSEVFIGKGTWLTNRVTIAKGAFLPDFSIIAAGSLVNKNFSEITEMGAFFAGRPASFKGVTGRRIINVQKQNELFRYFLDTGEVSLDCEKDDYWFNDRFGKN